MSKHCYDYARPALGTDILLFSERGGEYHTLLIERGNEPFKGFWAFPGGFVEEGESAEEAATRELQEETGLQITHLKQLGAFTRPGRDPRGWIVTVAYYAFVDIEQLSPTAGDDASKAEWLPLTSLPKLAFDHQEILDKALDLLFKS